MHGLAARTASLEFGPMLQWLLIAQAATASPPPVIDLLARPARSCSAAETADVVVCGRRDKDRYRIPPEYRTDDTAEGLGRAEMRIGNAQVGAAAERADVGGFPSNRIMLRFRLPL